MRGPPPAEISTLIRLCPSLGHPRSRADTATRIRGLRYRNSREQRAQSEKRRPCAGSRPAADFRRLSECHNNKSRTKIVIEACLCACSCAWVSHRLWCRATAAVSDARSATSTNATPRNLPLFLSDSIRTCSGGTACHHPVLADPGFSSPAPAPAPTNALEGKRL
jgi:hypothetical protein